ncbi:PDZ domain-containing protein [Polaromonas sp. P1(28)-8]|nr:PDZ domain-containing protein [Polaromonas sp. P1(28)-8]
MEAGAPAEKAGVEAGDIIIKFDGKQIEKSSDLPRMVGNVKPGTKAVVTVFRRGATKDLPVVIAEVEAEKPLRKASSPEAKPPVAGPAQALGLVVSDLPDAQKKELKVKGGVRVDSAEGGAARAGLHEGDVIVAIANSEITTVKEFEAALAKIDKSKPVNVLFRRGELAQFVLIRPAR